MAILEEFKAWREAEGYSISSLAAKLEVEYVTVWRYENEERKPEDDILAKLKKLSSGRINWETFNEIVE